MSTGHRPPRRGDFAIPFASSPPSPIKCGTGAGDELKSSEEKERIIAVLEDMKAKAKNVDSSLEGFVGAEMQKILKITENIEKKIKKAEENKYQTQLNQIENIKSKLFPEGVLQERKDNFLNFYINDPDFLKILTRHFDPFDFRFMVISLE